jgi:hypothetical protein
MLKSVTYYTPYLILYVLLYDYESQHIRFFTVCYDYAFYDLLNRPAALL